MVLLTPQSAGDDGHFACVSAGYSRYVNGANYEMSTAPVTYIYEFDSNVLHEGITE